MGFFDSILGSAPTSTSSSGFSTLPSTIRSSFKGLSRASRQFLDPRNPDNISRFEPLAQTADESAAFDRMRQGFAPTNESLQSDLSMLTNPFDSFVIDEMNRQAGGDYSILKQSLNEAGQLGSNRQMLGANDIDLSRLNQIGMFKQDQYNKMLDTALGRLTDLRMNDTNNLLNIGDFQRTLDWNTKQAPINMLKEWGGINTTLPQSGGTTTTQSGGSSGLLGTIGGALSAADTAFGSGGFLSGLMSSTSPASQYTNTGWNALLGRN